MSGPESTDGRDNPRYLDLRSRARSDLDRLVLLLLAKTGLEMNDLVGLKVSDLDLDGGFISVRQNDRNIRVSLSRSTVEELRGYLGSRPGQIYLLEGRCGKPITVKWKRCFLSKLRDDPGEKEPLIDGADGKGPTL